MTPDEVLKDLRDIHLPGAPTADPVAGFAPGPFLVLAAVLLAVAVLRWVRRTQWRREARRRLAEIAREPDTAARWSATVDLLRRVAPVGRDGPPPDVVFLPAERIGAAEVEILHAHLRARLGR